MLTEQEILEVLRSTKEPLKAKEVSAILSRRKSTPVPKKEINRLLHLMKSKGNVIQNEETYCWRTADGKTAKAQTDQKDSEQRSPSYYDVLQVVPSADPLVIEKAYKALVSLYHPDRAKASERSRMEERLKLINLAYEVLSDATKRRKYDQKVSEQDWSHGSR